MMTTTKGTMEEKENKEDKEEEDEDDEAEGKFVNHYLHDFHDDHLRTKVSRHGINIKPKMSSLATTLCSFTSPSPV